MTILFSMTFTFPSYGEWTKLGEDSKDNAYYTDFSRIRNVDGYLYWWNLQDYSKRSPYGDLSAILYRQGDCKLFRLKTFTGIFYNNPMGKGIGRTENATNPQWEFPNPQSIKEAILKSVCNYKK